MCLTQSIRQPERRYISEVSERRMVLKGDGVYIVKDARALKLSVRFSKPRKKTPYILDVLSVTSSDTVQWFSKPKKKTRHWTGRVERVFQLLNPDAHGYDENNIVNTKYDTNPLNYTLNGHAAKTLTKQPARAAASNVDLTEPPKPGHLRDITSNHHNTSPVALHISVNMSRYDIWKEEWVQQCKSASTWIHWSAFRYAPSTIHTPAAYPPVKSDLVLLRRASQGPWS